MNERSMLMGIATLAAQGLNLGLSGEDFAEQVCRKFGDIQYETFLKIFPKEDILKKLQSVPEAWTLLEPHQPALEEFMRGFYEAFDGDDENAAPPDQPLADKTAKATKPSKKGKKKNAA